MEWTDLPNMNQLQQIKYASYILYNNHVIDSRVSKYCLTEIGRGAHYRSPERFFSNDASKSKITQFYLKW